MCAVILTSYCYMCWAVRSVRVQVLCTNPAEVSQGGLQGSSDGLWMHRRTANRGPLLHAISRLARRHHLATQSIGC